MPFDQIVRRTLVEKGWSGDLKFRAETLDGESYLLRISPREKMEAVSQCYFRMKEAEKLPISMCHALEWGVCEEGVYFIQSWVDGDDAEAVIPKLDIASQYAYGLRAGKDLQKLHTMPAPGSAQPWELRYGRKIDRKLQMYAASELKYDEDECILSYISENRHLIAGRPVSYQHGDHHIGNMMVRKSGELVLIDFEKEDYGDPWEEFNRIVWSAQTSPYFATGIIDGYFEGNVPELFWKLLALYICTNTLSSLPWAIPFGEKEICVMREQQRQVLSWYDHMNRVIPSWYSRPVYLRRVRESDRDMYASLLRDKIVGRTYMVPDQVDDALAERIFGRYMERSASKDRYARIVCVGQTPIGVIHDVEIKGTSIELGWALLPAYHNKGYCTRAAKLAMEELSALGYTEVIAAAFQGNAASLRVMEKCGMQLTNFREMIPYRGAEHLCIYYAKRLEIKG